MKLSLSTMATNEPPKPQSLQAVSAITLFVEDITAAKEFYTAVFEVPVIFEDPTSCRVRFSNLIVNLLLATGASDSGLVDPAPVGGTDAGRRFQMSIWVDDLEPVYEQLVMSGVSQIQWPRLQPWGMKTLTFNDPAGHCWEVGQWVKQ